MKRRRYTSDPLERALRAHRRPPRDELVRSVHARIHDAPLAVRSRRPRAIGWAVGAVGASVFVAAGGLGIAAHSISVITHHITSGGSSASSPADNQYGVLCGAPPFVQCQITVAPAVQQVIIHGTHPRFATIRVRLVTPAVETVTAQFATANRTASAGVDYVGASGTLVFGPGVRERDVKITVLSRRAVGVRIFVVRVSSLSPRLRVVGHQGRATVVIRGPHDA